MIYKVRAYTDALNTSLVYAVEAPNPDDAKEAVKKKLQRFGYRVTRIYHNYELNGYINAYETNK